MKEGLSRFITVSTEDDNEIEADTKEKAVSNSEEEKKQKKSTERAKRHLNSQTSLLVCQ